VAIVARGAEALRAARASIEGEGFKVRDYVCDVANTSEIEAVFGRVVADLGRVDILVNNAGTSRAMAFEAVTDEIGSLLDRFSAAEIDGIRDAMRELGDGWRYPLIERHSGNTAAARRS
jgi:NAD(P)-dependent dehydrogenase (short-subunit alcohol dehydrogenase family)